MRCFAREESIFLSFPACLTSMKDPDSFLSASCEYIYSWSVAQLLDTVNITYGKNTKYGTMLGKQKEGMSLSWAKEITKLLSAGLFFLGGSLYTFLPFNSLQLVVIHIFGHSKIFSYQLMLWHWKFQIQSKIHWAATTRFSREGDQSLLKPTAVNSVWQ